MRKIIFLDIDGVINCKTTKEKIPVLGYTGVDNTLVKRLKKITDSTGAEIVLSSTWKDGWDHEYEKCKRWVRYLRDEFQKEGLEISDITPPEEHWTNRGASISQWLAGNTTDEFVILDDFFFAEFVEFNLTPHLVLTNPKSGLTDADVQNAINILSGELDDKPKEKLLEELWMRDSGG